eukprot:TRINITY_DN2831_c0_g1_i1.p1 TRINITY_DN2831_c0_g1~~TRINITY_DN2831_c0_g1_i1.p1  ORF type:complete len:1178 (-),score=185.57 TRINITY_DN2831_c0_g1_i1:64-3597(-)
MQPRTSEITKSLNWLCLQFREEWERNMPFPLQLFAFVRLSVPPHSATSLRNKLSKFEHYDPWGSKFLDWAAEFFVEREPVVCCFYQHQCTLNGKAPCKNKQSCLASHYCALCGGNHGAFTMKQDSLMCSVSRALDALGDDFHEFLSFLDSKRGAFLEFNPSPPSVDTILKIFVRLRTTRSNPSALPKTPPAAVGTTAPRGAPPKSSHPATPTSSSSSSSKVPRNTPGSRGESKDSNREWKTDSRRTPVLAENSQDRDSLLFGAASVSETVNYSSPIVIALRSVAKETFSEPNTVYCDPKKQSSNHKCKQCPFAHTAKQLTPPSVHKRYCDINSDKFRLAVLFGDWEGRGLFELPLSVFYPTRPTKVILHNASLPVNLQCSASSIATVGQVQAYGKLCRTFLFTGKCTYWGNCFYLHLDPSEFEKLTVSMLCDSVHRGIKCPHEAYCSYRHSALHLTVPEGFHHSTAASGEKDYSIALTWRTIKGSIKYHNVPLRYLARTLGSENENYTLCTDYKCDAFHACALVHLILDYYRWDGREKSIPVHHYLRKFVRVQVVQPQSINPWIPTPQDTSGSDSPTPSLSEEDDLEEGEFDEEYPVSAIFGATPYLAQEQTVKKSQKVNFAKDLRRLMETLQEESNIALQWEALDRVVLKERHRRLPAQLRLWWEPRSKRYDTPLKLLVNSDALNSPGGNFVYLENLKIGSGATSQVFIGLKNDDATEIALKIMTDEMDEHKDRIFRTEVETLKRQNWVPGVVKYYGCYNAIELREEITGGHVKRAVRVIALELMEYSLADVYSLWRSPECPRKGVIGSRYHFRAMQYVGVSLIRTLRGLRSRTGHGDSWVVHRDLKPTNVLFDVQNQVRLIDFGFSKEIQWGHAAQQSNTAMRPHDRAFASPEIQNRRGANETTDMFSFGLLLYSMLIVDDGTEDQGKIAPWHIKLDPPSHDKESGVKFTDPGKLEQIWSRYPHRAAWVQDLLDQLLKYEWKKRYFYNESCKPQLGCDYLLRHPIFWSDFKATSFLVTVGDVASPDNMSPDLERIDEAVMAALADTDSQSWLFDKVYSKGHWWYHHLDEWLQKIVIDGVPSKKIPPFAENPAMHKKPRTLLRFIRNVSVHRTAGDEKFIDEKPYFLQRFPSLVTRLWRVIMKNTQLVQKPLLSQYMDAEPTISIDHRSGHPDAWV